MTISTHVAIFITDYSEFCADKHGTFAELSAKLLKNSGLQEEIRCYDVIKSQFPTDDELKDIKAIWITGSRSDAFADEPWILNLKTFLQDKVLSREDIRLVGICFGHQIIARSLGSKVGQFNILESHQDIVYETPKGCKNIGSSKRTESQGFYKKDKILTFQGHPEFTKSFTEDALEMKLKDGKITQDAYEDAINVLNNNEHHGSKIGEVIVNFIQSV
ncbi:unnamed protein product [Wickerhamomyces anomalus]